MRFFACFISKSDLVVTFLSRFSGFASRPLRSRVMARKRRRERTAETRRARRSAEGRRGAEELPVRRVPESRSAGGPRLSFSLRESPRSPRLRGAFFPSFRPLAPALGPQCAGVRETRALRVVDQLGQRLA